MRSQIFVILLLLSVAIYNVNFGTDAKKRVLECLIPLSLFPPFPQRSNAMDKLFPTSNTLNRIARRSTPDAEAQNASVLF
jgi:hypothetical protein